jgi:glycine/D-amino acid oxidase-like deaminating enzyme
MLDDRTTVQNDLRGGTAPWLAGEPARRRGVIGGNMRCDVLIVGAGITGSMMADHLTALGRHVTIIDRERPGFGSTTASTAMLLWEIDCSLSELTSFYGFERAATIYRRSVMAVHGLQHRIAEVGIPCALRPRDSLYLAAGETGAREVLAEHELRQRANLPGAYLDYLTLKRALAFDREAAILSPGAAEVNPLQLSHGLLDHARAQGARLFDAEAVSYDSAGRSVMVGLENGYAIEADRVILCTGYVMPDIVDAKLHRTASSWAIATPPQAVGTLWSNGMLVWEASENYLYARTTIDDRIIIGGEDEPDVTNPEDRDRRMPEKRLALQQRLSELWPSANAAVDFTWSGAFGETEDGLPLIGPVSHHPGVYAAYGYGGNGITFSFLASRLVGRMIGGHGEAWYDEFAIDRPSVKPPEGSPGDPELAG